VGYSRDRTAPNGSLPTCRRSRAARAVGRRPPGNVGAPGDCRRAIDEVIDINGRLDILINNAGITMDKTVAAMTETTGHSVLA